MAEYGEGVRRTAGVLQKTVRTRKPQTRGEPEPRAREAEPPPRRARARVSGRNGEGPGFDRERFGPLHDRLASAQSVLLTSHLFPDGDSIASEVALALHLTAQGKSVRIVHEIAPLERYSVVLDLLPPNFLFDWTGPQATVDADLAVCLDVSSWDYMGRLGDWLRASAVEVAAIDHHRLGSRFGDHDVVIESASSTGEVLYRYFRATQAAVSPAIAEAIYASILFDTGCFRLGLAGNETIRLSAELLEYGIDHARICRELFEVDSWEKVDLMRHALGKLQSGCGGRLAWLSIPQDLFHVTGARFADADGILGELLSLRELDLCTMFREVNGHEVKATFRSKGAQDVGLVAQEFGGGGRRTASGVLLPGTLHQVMESVLPRLQAFFPERRGRGGAATSARLLQPLS